MKVLLSTCLLFVLLPTVALLKCHQCIASKKESCNNPLEIECADDEDSCFSGTAEISLGGVPLITLFAKTCVNSKYLPGGTYFMGTDYNIAIVAKAELCQTDKCNNKLICLPHHHRELPENGKKCPACLSFHSDRCEAQDKISCRGNETKCLYIGVKGKGTGPLDLEYYLALRGCATPNYCNEPRGASGIIGDLITNNITHLKCTNACPNVSIRSGRIH